MVVRILLRHDAFTICRHRICRHREVRNLNFRFAILHRQTQADIFSLGLLFLLPQVFFWRETLGWRTLGDQDAVFWFFPAYDFVANLIRAGHLPLWNPDYYSGVPLFAQWQAGILDPLNWIHLFGATSRTLTLSLQLSFSLSMMAMWLYARALGMSRRAGIVAATIYGLSGFAVARTLYPGFLHIYALVPLVLMVTERLFQERRWRDVAFGALIVAWQVFAAHPQPLIYSSLTAGFYALFAVLVRVKLPIAEWRGSLRFLIQFSTIFLLGAGLAAIQLLPAAEIAGRSVRQDWPYEMFTLHSIHPASLLTMVIPFFQGGGRAPYRMDYWGTSWHHNESQIYLGMLALALAAGGVVLAVRRRYAVGIFWSAVVMLGGLLVLGKYSGPLARLLYQIPIINQFRSPNRHWQEVTLAVAVLAGYAVDRLLKEPASSHPELSRAVQFASLMLTLLIGIVCGIALSHRDFLEKILVSLPDLGGLEPGFLSSAQREFILPFGLAIIATLALWLWLRSVSRARWYLPILTLLLVDYHFYATNAPITHNARIESQIGTAVPAWLREKVEESRTVSPDRLFRSHLMLTPEDGEFSQFWFAGHPMVTGYDPLLDGRYKNFSGVDEAGRSWLSTMLQSGDRTLDLLNAQYLMVPGRDERGADNLDNSRWREVGSLEGESPFAGYRVFENRQVFPRAWLVQRVKEAWEGDQLKIIRGEMRDSEGVLIDLRSTALVEPVRPDAKERAWFGDYLDPVVAFSAATASPGAATIRSFQADRILIETCADWRSVLVLSEHADSGWQVSVDGQPAQWYRVDYELRGVPLSAGIHRVEFTYRSAPIKNGAVISLISALLISAIFTVSVISRGAIQIHPPIRDGVA